MAKVTEPLAFFDDLVHILARDDANVLEIPKPPVTSVPNPRYPLLKIITVPSRSALASMHANLESDMQYVASQSSTSYAPGRFKKTKLPTSLDEVTIACIPRYVRLVLTDGTHGPLVDLQYRVDNLDEGLSLSYLHCSGNAALAKSGLFTYRKFAQNDPTAFKTAYVGARKFNVMSAVEGAKLIRTLYDKITK